MTMQQSNQGPMFSPDGFRSFVGGIVSIARALALTVEVFLHRAGSFGERYFGLQVGLSMLILFVFPMFWEGHDPRPVFRYLLAFVIAVVICRVKIAARVRRGGPPVHSYYTGTPRLVRLFPRMKEETIKNTVEPFLVIAIGLFTLGISEPLGAYLFFAGIALALSTGLTRDYDRRRAMDLNDAYIDQAQAVQRMRDMRGDK